MMKLLKKWFSLSATNTFIPLAREAFEHQEDHMVFSTNTAT
jgi:hypothetical protein